MRLKSSVKLKLQRPPKQLVLNVQRSRLRKKKKLRLRLHNKLQKNKKVLPGFKPPKSLISQSKMISISTIFDEIKKNQGPK